MIFFVLEGLKEKAGLLIPMEATLTNRPSSIQKTQNPAAYDNVSRRKDSPIEEEDGSFYQTQSILIYQSRSVEAFQQGREF